MGSSDDAAKKEDSAEDDDDADICAGDADADAEGPSSGSDVDSDDGKTSDGGKQTQIIQHFDLEQEERRTVQRLLVRNQWQRCRVHNCTGTDLGVCLRRTDGALFVNAHPIDRDAEEKAEAED